MTAKEAREITENNILTRVLGIIKSAAKSGYDNANMYLSENEINGLKKLGYNVTLSNPKISSSYDNCYEIKW